MYMEGDTTKLRDNIYNLNTSDFEVQLDNTIKYYLKRYDNEK